MKRIGSLMSVIIPLSAILLFHPSLFCNGDDDSDEYKNITEIIRSHHYEVKVHHVTTTDGYILPLFRISKNKVKSSSSKDPVLLMHGILFEPSLWVANKPENNLPYILADEGYDVWLGTLRGCTLGKKHKTLSSNQAEFWEFSIDEMAEYDLAESVDHILKDTGKKQIHLIAHSGGTTVAFALLSSKIEYNKKIRSYHAFAPITRMDHVPSPYLRYGAKVRDYIVFILKTFGYNEIYPHSMTDDILAHSLCKSPLKGFCAEYWFLSFGFDHVEVDKDLLPVYLQFFPAGTSLRTAHHVLQIIDASKFQHYDYGEDKNQEKYRQKNPPKYDLTKITTSVSLYSGEGDWIAVPKDVDYIREDIPKLNLDYRVPFENFNHIDFLWAKDVDDLLFDKVVQTLGSA